MGTDKAWLEFAGRPMIEWVLAAAASATASLSIIINSANPNAERYQELAAKWNAKVLYDLHDHQGPLGGIHTALHPLPQNNAALILACDLPFLTVEFLALLCQKHCDGQAQITVPLNQAGRWQPLVAIYSASCLAAVEAQLAAQQLRVDRLFDLVRTEHIAFSVFAHLPGAQKLFLNINTPQDQRDAATG